MLQFLYNKMIVSYSLTCSGISSISIELLSEIRKYTDPSNFVKELYVVVVEFPVLPEDGSPEDGARLVGDWQPARVLVQYQLLYRGERWAFKPVVTLHNEKVLP